MHRIAIAGLSLLETDQEDLERLGPPEEADLFARELADALGASEVVLLSTCNRVEVAFAREEGSGPGPADLERLAGELGQGSDPDLARRLHLHTGRSAVRYLFRVACSLESLVVGEDQILAQVREAYARAERSGLAGPLLGSLFRAAFQVGKLVRTRTDLSHHTVSVASLALDELRERAGSAPLAATVLGAGRMGRLLAQGWRDRGGSIEAIVSRTQASADRLAAEVGGRATTLDALRAGLADPKTGSEAPGATGAPGAILAATGAPGFVLSADELRALARGASPESPLRLVDVALPRDLEPVDDPRVDTVDIESLRAIAERNRLLRARDAAEAEHIVDERVESFLHRHSDPLVARAITDLRQGSAELYRREVGGLRAGRLAELPDDQRRAIERWAHTAFGRLSHLATDALKRLASEVEPLRPDATANTEVPGASPTLREERA